MDGLPPVVHGDSSKRFNGIFHALDTTPQVHKTTDGNRSVPHCPTHGQLRLSVFFVFFGLHPMLFEALRAGAFTLNNRMLMAPLTRARPSSGVDHHQQALGRLLGGVADFVGLIDRVPRRVARCEPRAHTVGADLHFALQHREVFLGARLVRF